VTPSPPRIVGVGHRRTLSAGSGASSNCGSLEELTARNEELELKRKQVCTLRFEL
jgi:hypothetical protein